MVASGGSKSQNNEDIWSVKLLWQIVVASGGPKRLTLKVLDVSSLHGASSLPPAGRNPQKMKVFDFVASVADRRGLQRVLQLVFSVSKVVEQSLDPLHLSVGVGQA